MLPSFDLLQAVGVLGAPASGLWAYLDPGAGSLMFQMLIAAMLSGTYLLRSSIWSLKRRIARGLAKE
jgi:hypothetical protein